MRHNATSVPVELPSQVIDLLSEVGNELEVIVDELADDPTLEVSDDDADWYLTVVRDYANEILQRVEEIEDQLLHRDAD